MNNITLVSSYLQFKNPILGKPTYAIEEHYHARRVVVMINGKETQFRYMAHEMPFVATEDEIVEAIKTQLVTI